MSLEENVAIQCGQEWVGLDLGPCYLCSWGIQTLSSLLQPLRKGQGDWTCRREETQQAPSAHYLLYKTQVTEGALEL